MNMKLFLSLFAIGILLYVLYMFYSQRQVAYLSILLYRNGDADAYLKELNSFSSKVFFNKRLRMMMQIDAYLLKNDTQQLENLFDEVKLIHLSEADRMVVLQKEFSYRISKEENDKADRIYEEMADLLHQMSEKNKKKYSDTVRDCGYSRNLYVNHSGKDAAELEKMARNVTDTIPSGVYFYRAAQAWYLKDEKKKAKDCLQKALQKLKGTAEEKRLKMVYDSPTLEGIMRP